MKTFVRKNIEKEEDLQPYVKALFMEMHDSGVKSSIKNDWKKMHILLTSNYRKLYESVDLKSARTEFIKYFNSFDQFHNLDINIGAKVSIISASVIGDRLELWGHLEPKTITNIYYEDDGKLKQFEFNNDPTDVYPKAELFSYNNDHLDNTIFFNSYNDAHAALMMILLKKPNELELGKGGFSSNAIKETTINTKEILTMRNAKSEGSTAKKNVVEGVENRGPKWYVTYDYYGSNREVPLYRKTRPVYAESAEAASALCQKLTGGQVINVDRAPSQIMKKVDESFFAAFDTELTTFAATRESLGKLGAATLMKGSGTADDPYLGETANRYTMVADMVEISNKLDTPVHFMHEGKGYVATIRGVMESDEFDSLDELDEAKIAPGTTKDDRYGQWNIRYDLRPVAGSKEYRGRAWHSKSVKTPEIKLTGSSADDVRAQLIATIDSTKSQKEIDPSQRVNIDFNVLVTKNIIGHKDIIYGDTELINGTPTLLISVESQPGFQKATDRTSVAQRTESSTGQHAFSLSGKKAIAAGLTHARYILGEPFTYMDGITGYPLKFSSEVHPGDKFRLTEPGVTVAYPRDVAEGANEDGVFGGIFSKKEEVTEAAAGQYVIEGTAAEFFGELKAGMKDIVDAYAEHQTKGRSVPAAPDSSKFVAAVGGMIEYAENIHISGGSYGIPKTFKMFIKIGGAISSAVKDEIKQEFAELISVLSGHTISDMLYTEDGHRFIFDKADGTNWGGFGVMIDKKDPPKASVTESDECTITEIGQNPTTGAKVIAWQNTPLSGTHWVIEGYDIHFTPTEVTVSKSGEVKWSKKGDYSRPVNKHLQGAKRIVSGLVNQTNPDPGAHGRQLFGSIKRQWFKDKDKWESALDNFIHLKLGGRAEIDNRGEDGIYCHNEYGKLIAMWGGRWHPDKGYIDGIKGSVTESDEGKAKIRKYKDRNGVIKYEVLDSDGVRVKGDLSHQAAKDYLIANRSEMMEDAVVTEGNDQGRAVSKLSALITSIGGRVKYEGVKFGDKRYNYSVPINALDEFFKLLDLAGYVRERCTEKYGRVCQDFDSWWKHPTWNLSLLAIRGNNNTVSGMIRQESISKEKPSSKEIGQKVAESSKSKKVNENKFARKNITSSEELLPYVKMLCKEMHDAGVEYNQWGNDVKGLFGRLTSNYRLYESADLGNARKKFIEYFNSLNQFQNMDVSIGTKVSIMSSSLQGDGIELWGYLEPKTITNIKYAADGSYEHFEFNNDPTDGYPRTELFSYNGEEVQHSILFNNYNDAHSALMMILLKKPNELHIRNHVLGEIAESEDYSISSMDPEYNEDDEDSSENEFYVALYDENENTTFVGRLRNDGRKWKEDKIAGVAPYNWPCHGYMGYLSANDVMQWINKDYERGFEVKGPFPTKDAAIQWAEHNFGPLNESVVTESKPGRISVNMKQMDKWKVDQDNIKYYDNLMKAKGQVYSLDLTPYKHFLDEFNIFYTAPLDETIDCTDELEAMHCEGFRELAFRNKNITESNETISSEELLNFLSNSRTTTGKIGQPYIYCSIHAHPFANLIVVAHFSKTHSLLQQQNAMYTFNINGKNKSYPESSEVAGDLVKYTLLFDDLAKYESFLTMFILKYGENKIIRKVLDNQSITTEAKGSKSIDTLQWTDYLYIANVDDRFTVVETILTKGMNLSESVDNDAHEKFQNLQSMAVTPIIDKKYIMAYLYLVGSTVRNMQPPEIVTCKKISNNEYTVKLSDGRIAEFPYRTTNKLVAMPLFFNSVEKFDAFRTLIALQFDINLPAINDKLAEAKHGLSKKVKIIAGPAKGKTGRVGEIRNGAYKGAEKSYTIDLDDGSNIRCSAKQMRLINDEPVTEDQKTNSYRQQFGESTNAEEMKQLTSKLKAAKTDADREAIRLEIRKLKGEMELRAADCIATRAPIKIKEAAPDRRSNWMGTFEETVVALDGKNRGKIDWNSATHFYNQRMDPKEAAEKYVANRVDESIHFSKGAYPDVDHMPGNVVRDWGDKPKKQVISFKNRSAWETLADEVNRKLYDDNASYVSMAGMKEVSINDVPFARWMDVTSSGWVQTTPITESTVAKSTQIVVPTEDGIGWQDIRLVAGEGKLTQKTVKQAIEVIRRQRKPAVTEAGKKGMSAHAKEMAKKSEEYYAKAVKDREEKYGETFNVGNAIVTKKGKE